MGSLYRNLDVMFNANQRSKRAEITLKKITFSEGNHLFSGNSREMLIRLKFQRDGTGNGFPNI